MRLQNGTVFHLPAMGLQAHALVAGDDVEMQVKDRLSGRRLVELGNENAIGLKGLLHRIGDLLDNRNGARENRRIRILQIA